MTTTDPVGHDFNLRSVQARQGIVLVNAKLDESELSLRKEYLAKNNADCFYKQQAGGEEDKVYNLEPAFVVRVAAHLGRGGRFGSSGGLRGYGGARNVGTQESRVPIVSTLNGMRGKSETDVEDQLVCIGLADNSERDSGGVGVNALSGGTLTVTNTGCYTIRLGDLVMWKAPTKAELKELRPIAGNVANHGDRGARQRVPAILVPYLPEKTDFMRPEARAAALSSLYDDDGKAKSPKPSTQGLDGSFVHGMSELVESLVAIIMAVNATPPNQAAPDAQSIQTKLVKLLRAQEPGNPQENAAFQRFIVAAAQLRQRIENKVIGTARTGAPPGHDFTLQLHHYG